MNAETYTFGVEIECLIPVANAPAVGGYHCGVQVAALPAGWNAQRDGSIRTRRGMVGVEIVSPVLQGAEGVRQLKAACEWLASIGAAVNKSTGLHIHVGTAKDDATLRRIVTVAANFEKAIYAATGTKARERGCFCRTVQQSQNHRDGRFAYATRYHVLNVLTQHDTVEFRAFAGTINFTKIVAYVRLCIGLVERAVEMKRLPKWEAKPVAETSPIKRGGEGLTALNRLFFWLGWNRGRVDRTYGITGAEVGPSLKQVKNQLVRLARKYDAAQ